MPTITLLENRYANIDPDDARGPWVLNLPNMTSGASSPDNGIWCGVCSTTYGATAVTINATGTAQIARPSGAAASISTIFTGQSINLEYDSDKDQWRVYADTFPGVQLAAFRGTPANVNPGAGYTAISGYPNAVNTAMFTTAPNLSTGILTLPRQALYRLTAQYVFQQGNDNKELACLLWIRSSVSGDTVADSIQISDDKTNWRAVGVTALIEGQANETFQMGLSRVNQSMGSCSFETATFQIELVEGRFANPITRTGS